MRFSTAIVALSAAASAAAQIALPSTIPILGYPFSASCQQAVLGVLTQGNFSTCFHAADLLPLLSSNGSIIPILDNFMSDLCYSSSCSNATLNAAAQQVLAGCSADLAQAGLTNSTVTAAFSAYPTVREVLCLKTTQAFNRNTYNGSLGEAPIPITPSTYNYTMGYFCVTSLLSQLSAYYGTNLTVPSIVSAVSGGNATAVNLTTSINPNIICNECIFSAVNVIESAYPIVGRVPLSAVFAAINMTSPVPANTTLNALMNATCAYKNYTVMPGRVTQNVTVSIVDNTFPFNVTKA